MQHTNIEPTEPELPPDYTWEGQVKLFEKTHCKIINKGIFIKTTDKANILMNESLLKTAYSHLYYETPVYNKKGEVTGKANSFLVVLSELSKKETMEAEAKIRGLVTDTTLTINTKGLSAYEIFFAHRFGGTTKTPIC